MLKEFLGDNVDSDCNFSQMSEILNELSPVYFEAALEDQETPTDRQIDCIELKFAKILGFVFVFKLDIEVLSICTHESSCGLGHEFIEELKSSIREKSTLNTGSMLRGNL